jgi:hypothetical protein
MPNAFEEKLAILCIDELIVIVRLFLNTRELDDDEINKTKGIQRV